MGAALQEFRDLYYSWVLTACEWRALHADAGVMAEQVFERLEASRKPLDLSLAYRTIRDVVMDAYKAIASQRSILEVFRGAKADPLENGPVDDAAAKQHREFLSRLSERDRESVQLVLWDGLTPAEASRAIRLSEAKVQERFASGLTRFGTQVAKQGSVLESDQIAAIIAGLKPGRHRR